MLLLKYPIVARLHTLVDWDLPVWDGTGVEACRRDTGGVPPPGGGGIVDGCAVLDDQGSVRLELGPGAQPMPDPLS